LLRGRMSCSAEPASDDGLNGRSADILANSGLYVTSATSNMSPDLDMKRIVYVLTVAICSLPGCDSRSESEKLQGEWIFEESRGVFNFYVPPTSRSVQRLTFAGDAFTYDSLSTSRYYKDDPRPSISGNYSCDRTASPKRITFVFVDTSGKKRTVN